MKRIFVYTFLFVLSFIGCAVTIARLDWFFFGSLIVFAITCGLMERHYKVLHGELDDIFGSDSPMR